MILKPTETKTLPSLSAYIAAHSCCTQSCHPLICLVDAGGYLCSTHVYIHRKKYSYTCI